MICKTVVNDLKVTPSTYKTMMQRCWDDYIMGSTADHTGAYSEGLSKRLKTGRPEKDVLIFENILNPH